MNKKIRVRYAPSPTGFLHIGNARTALFNYLFASHYKGDFIIRIEDTDLNRNIESSEQNQLDKLKWLGINWKEGPDCGGSLGPYRQSERLNIYLKYAQLLIDKKKAYKEYKKENSDVFVIRFRVPSNKKYEFNDLVRGSLSFESEEIEDWILIKENGFPTYNYAVAIDDHLMNITHILRGEEHITNTPKQIMIYESFGWSIPFFGHISLILNENRKKISKRDSNNILQFIQNYIDMGYLPKALFNFLSLLGFSPQTQKTILEPNELIDLFDIKRISKSPAIFDHKKLSFINSQYIKKMPLSELFNIVDVFFQKENIFLEKEFLKNLILLFQERISYIKEIIYLYNEFFVKEKKIDLKDILFIKNKINFNYLRQLYDMLSGLKKFDIDKINEIIRFFSQKTQLKGKDLFLILRISCTSRFEGPSLANYLYLLGKSKILNNIKKILSIE
ncbi:MAG: glutamyl-tRNA synthetase [Candidatus Phytoplasma cynodontis]|uniref:glutamate--tRNA ligase n=1 Tax='Cynodon dactylon' phytoplasma TaxID=295320 RepID=UPI001265BFB8|nr:glutamate--tRNA ligase ['Cynodon dactylon' phytoplasma]KAB8122007.1 glutamate--tRNA ligase ['Cynodon dactylon' phytoplasma]WIA07577.1 MAG: glutamyl-tRNA synthetase [Candidatus Phytoplasma cynodontis]